MRFLPAVAFSAISYWMLGQHWPSIFTVYIVCIRIGLRSDLLKFAIYLLTLLLTSSAAAATAFFISAGIGVFGLANLCAAMLYVCQMVTQLYCTAENISGIKYCGFSYLDYLEENSLANGLIMANGY